MKIAIFETEHFEAAYPLVRLFDDGQNEITVFSYSPARRQLAYMLADKGSQYNWVTKEEHQSPRSFIYTIYKETKKRKIDLIYLNTVSDNYFFYAMMAIFLPKVRIVLTVHMINSLFETRQKYRPRKLVHAIGKRLLRSAINEYNVLSQPMVPALQQRLGKSKKVYNIPGGIFEGHQPHSSLQDPIHIVIPGSIDSKRRNYDHAFELLARLKKENIPIKMTFLGRFCGEYGQFVLSKSKQWGNTLSYYGNEEIDQPEFDRVIQSADFLFNPSVVNTLTDDSIKETYGITISSGNISDAIRHAKPVIIPQSLTIDPWFEYSCIRYATVDDIVKFIRSIAETPELYKNLLQATCQSAKEYTVGKIKERMGIWGISK
jgi:glycosyltransferase involved in cell wall biosynthesis